MDRESLVIQLTSPNEMHSNTCSAVCFQSPYRPRLGIANALGGCDEAESWNEYLATQC
jgi:hypothetical protein